MLRVPCTCLDLDDFVFDFVLLTLWSLMAQTVCIEVVVARCLPVLARHSFFF